jgi:3'(2'), 5'-bisphosphate nucleotidase
LNVNELKFETNKLLPIAIQAAEAACKEILDVYNSGNFEAEAKGDSSPLTRADKQAHHKISEILKASDLPILSEEGRSIPYEERKNWDYFWMVDPLDGTKEFIKRNGEFTVNIALIHQGNPILGVVAIPVTGEVYYALKSTGAFVKSGDLTRELPRRTQSSQGQAGLRVVASRSHMSEETESFIAGLHSPVLVSKGSSLKFMLLADGKADVYPRFAPTMEWDTAAAHAIVNEVGFSVYQKDTTLPLLYNKENLLNPFFLVV